MNTLEPLTELSIRPAIEPPLWQTIGQAYSEWFRHFADVLRATWFWIILLGAMMGTADWLKWSMSVEQVRSLKAGVPLCCSFLPLSILL